MVQKVTKTKVVQQLKKLRSLGLTQQALAYKLGVSLPTISSWEHGKSEPRKVHKEKITALYEEAFGLAKLDEATLMQKRAAVWQVQNEDMLADIKNSAQVFDKLILKITYHTNTIEGNTMTEDDTAEVLFNQKVLHEHALTEQLEATNHRKALLFAFDLVNGGDVTIEDILQLHKILMAGILDNAGMFRRHSVRILGSNVPLANHLKIESLMQSFITEYNKKVKLSDVVQHIAQTHATFEQIHPFSDGNGRIGRLLMTILALKQGLPPVLVLQERKHAYYNYLREAQLGGDVGFLELFVCDALHAAHSVMSEA